jgi:hypothetical protein
MDSNNKQQRSDHTSSYASDNFERSESCGSGSGGDSPPPEGDDRSGDGKGNEGFISNYGPSKQGRRQKRFKDIEMEHPDVQSCLYGPSKQAYDAKAKSKMALEFKSTHFAPL